MAFSPYPLPQMERRRIELCTKDVRWVLPRIKERILWSMHDLTSKRAVSKLQPSLNLVSLLGAQQYP